MRGTGYPKGSVADPGFYVCPGLLIRALGIMIWVVHPGSRIRTLPKGTFYDFFICTLTAELIGKSFVSPDPDNLVKSLNIFIISVLLSFYIIPDRYLLQVIPEKVIPEKPGRGITVNISPKPVLGIRDILLRIRILILVSIPLNIYITILDPTPDQTPFFRDFTDAKKYFFHIFTYNLPACTITLVFKFYFASIISFCSTPYEKREGSGAGSGSLPLTNASECRSESPTLPETQA